MDEPRPRFLKAVGLLAGGGALAHGITAAALPILSRLYSPDDFTVLAVYSGVVSICAVAAALRFDLAIPVATDDDDARHLFALALIFSVITSIALALLLLMAGSQIASSLQQPQLGRFLWLIPIGVGLASVASALQYWFARRGMFALLVRSRIAQSVSGAMAQVGLGLFALAPLGLLLGQVINSLVACSWLGARVADPGGQRIWRPMSLQGLRERLSRYRRFPTFSSLEALANAVSMHLPILLIARLAAGPEAGYVMLGMSVMQAPMSLIGAAVGQFYVSRAATEHRSGQLAQFTSDVVRQLTRLGIGPILAAGLAAPALFPLVFGAEWQRAGDLVTWMTPWFALQFLAVPMGLALHVTQRLRQAFMLQLFGLVVRVGAVVLAAMIWHQQVAESFAVSGALFYLVYFLVVINAASISPGSLALTLLKEWRHLSAWIVAGVVTRVVLQAMSS